jgi:hypothetical protein
MAETFTDPTTAPVSRFRQRRADVVVVEPEPIPAVSKRPQS